MWQADMSTRCWPSSGKVTPRSIWNGSVTFGLAAVPIRVYAEIEDKSVHFHWVHAKDGARIKQLRICSKEGMAVPYNEVAKGYELRHGEYVMLGHEEIDAAAGGRSHRIELQEFVRMQEIDPVFYERPYHLGTGNGGEDAYRLLQDALERSGRVAIGRWVFHNREYLVAIRPLDGVLVLHTMRFADELVDPGSLGVPNPSRKPSEREVELARLLVDSMLEPFRPEDFRDTYRERVLALIESKARGEEPQLAPAEEPGESPDLIAALEASLSASGSGRGRASMPAPERTAARRRRARSGQ